MGEATEASAAKAQPTAKKPRAGDWVIAVVLLALFVVALVLSREWPFRAALFPMIIAVAGAVMSLLKLVGLTRATVGSRRAPQGVAVVPSERAADLPVQPADSSPEAENIRTSAAAAEEKPERAEILEERQRSELQTVDDDKEDDDSLEYVFATAGARAWAASLGWATAFFVLFFVIGAYITVPLFALLYLRFAGKVSWWAAATYAVVSGLIIYFVFDRVVFLPLPDGIFSFLQF